MHAPPSSNLCNVYFNAFKTTRNLIFKNWENLKRSLLPIEPFVNRISLINSSVSKRSVAVRTSFLACVQAAGRAEEGDFCEVNPN